MWERQLNVKKIICYMGGEGATFCKCDICPMLKIIFLIQLTVRTLLSRGL